MRLQLPLQLTLAAALSIALLASAPHAGATPAPTATTLAITSGGSAVTTVTSGTVVTLTATVLAGTTPVTVGQVKFCDASATYCEDIHIVGTAQLTSAGSATYKFRPGVGSHSYSAVFVGTPNGATVYAASTSSAAALSVTGHWPSITSLAASPSPSGNTYTLTATVSGNASTAPTGTVSFLNSSNGNSVLGTATLGAGTPGLSFFNTSNPDAGSAPDSVAVGDFNGDGIPDLAVANYESSTISVFLGNGDGTFTATSTSPTLASYPPKAIAAADLNGDGKMDLVVTTPGTVGTATIFLGNGDGTFAPVAVSPAVGSEPSSIAVGDFNGDGIPDLAVVSQCGYDANCVGPGSVTILLGDGTGNFTPAAASPIALGGVAWAIAAGDFNGDGNLDLAVTTYGSLDSANTTYGAAGAVTILLGNGNGAFTASSIPEGNYPWAIAAGDFNGDGITDLAVTNATSDSVSVLLGNGDGTFTTAASPQTGAGPFSITVGDFNGDGIPDLAVVNTSDYSAGEGEAMILLGNGDGTFTRNVTSPETGQLPISIASGDFNGDGIPDLVVANTGNYISSGAVTALLVENQSATATVTSVAAQPGAPGMLQVEASYADDSNYSASISGEAVLNELQTAPTVGVLLSASPITPTQALTVTIAVFGGGAGSPTPTGSVTLTSGSYTSAATTLISGAAQIVVPAGSLANGLDTLTANYTPDASSSAAYTSASGTTTVVVSTNTLVAPTVTVTPLSSSITTTQALTVTVAVSGGTGSPTATGSVTLTSGSYTSAATTLSGGSAQINIPAGSLATGTDTLAAVYNPDASSATVYARAGGASTVVVTSSTLITPTVTVTPSSSTIATTQALQVNVSVSGPSGNPNPAPTGSVTLTSGSYSSAATTLSGGGAQFNIPAGTLPTGSDTLSVSYTPDSSSTAVYTSASGTSTVVVTSSTLVTPTVTVTPLATSILTTQALQVDVSVSGLAGDPTPTGSVDLTSGSYDSGAITLSSGSAAINVPGNSLGAGTDTLSVSYVPDSASSATYSSAAGSSPVTVTAPNASPTVGSMSPAFQTAGDDAFTLTVNGAGFISGSTVYWGTTALTTQFVSAAQITALVPASEIASSGTDSITVESPMPGGGTSNTLQFEVDSSGSGSPSLTTNKATVTAGQSATYAVTLPSAPSAVTASCLNLPTGASCSYSSTTSTMTIATSTTTPAGTYQVTMVFTETVAGAASAFIFLPILMLPLVRARRKWTAGKIWFTACLGLVLLVASAGIGCGGGGTSSTQPPPSTHQITTSAVVTLTVQ
ncbi:MAG: FG-GAP-like repeat-containing protein [Terracidiphilus sp.]